MLLKKGNELPMVNGKPANQPAKLIVKLVNEDKEEETILNTESNAFHLAWLVGDDSFSATGFINSGGEEDIISLAHALGCMAAEQLLLDPVACNMLLIAFHAGVVKHQKESGVPTLSQITH